jgi:hypothetical protein
VRRGVVRSGTARTRGAPSFARLGSIKTPALLVRSPSCARAAEEAGTIAARTQASNVGSLRRRRFI